MFFAKRHIFNINIRQKKRWLKKTQIEFNKIKYKQN